MCNEDAPPLGPLLGHCVRRIKAWHKLRLAQAQYDITPTQSRVLMYLAENNGTVQQCALVQNMRIKPSTVNGILVRLEKKGLVRRTISGSDARRRLISITEQGKAQQATFIACFCETEQALLRGFSPAEVSQLRAFLIRAIQNLEEDMNL